MDARLFTCGVHLFIAHFAHPLLKMWAEGANGSRPERSVKAVESQELYDVSVPHPGGIASLRKEFVFGRALSYGATDFPYVGGRRSAISSASFRSFASMKTRRRDKPRASSDQRGGRPREYRRFGGSTK
jgi:hypothetical protein